MCDTIYSYGKRRQSSKKRKKETKKDRAKEIGSFSRFFSFKLLRTCI